MQFLLLASMLIVLSIDGQTFQFLSMPKHKAFKFIFILVKANEKKFHFSILILFQKLNNGQKFSNISVEQNKNYIILVFEFFSVKTWNIIKIVTVNNNHQTIM